jgi:RNA polymerase sigma factor (TIGR02999 family)
MAEHGKKLQICANRQFRCLSCQRTSDDVECDFTKFGYALRMAFEFKTGATIPLPSVTLLLQRVAQGDRGALDDVYSSLYPDLKQIARSTLYSQGRADAMQTTMLVHESFLRLLSRNDLRLQDRQHFFAYAAKTMRSIIIDCAREQLAECRGSGAEHIGLDAEAALHVPDFSASDELIRVDGALRELERLDPDLAELVEMRYFGGYKESEVAELLGVTDRTVRRRWNKARAWLLVELVDKHS